MALAIVALALPTASFAATTIDTTGSWNGATSESPFGDPNTATYGQTITAPSGSDHVLQSFTFYMKLPTSLIFRGEVYAWDGSKATGPALYESGQTHTTDGTVFQPITFNTGDLALKPGQQYVLFASVSKDSASDSGTASKGPWGATTGDVYSGGSLVFINNGYTASQWTSNAWTQAAGVDMAFKATFTSPAGKVLILGDAANRIGGSTGFPSWEELKANQLGYDADVVSGATWDSMSTADFAAYSALVIPDNKDCLGTGSGQGAAVSNTSTWTPAVTGRVLLTGADPEYHADHVNNPAGAQSFIQSAVAFAGSVPGQTGAYIATPCNNGSGSNPEAVLAGFGTIKVSSNENDATHIDPAVAGPGGLTDATLSGWSSFSHNVFDSFPSAFRVWTIGKSSSGSVTTSDGQVGFPNDLIRAGQPTAVTGAASGVTTSAATLNGSVNAAGGSTFHFDFGPTAAYGASTPAANAGSGTSAAPVSALVGGLAPGTTVHYRLVATNGTGTSFGADRTFITAATPQSLIALLTSSAVKLSGDLASFTLGCQVTTCNGLAIETVREKVQGSKVLGVSAARSKKKKIRRKTVTVGRVSFSLAPGTTKKITIKLNATGRKLEKKFKKLPVTLTIQLNGKTVSKKHLTLKPKTKKHKKHH